MGERVFPGKQGVFKVRNKRQMVKSLCFDSVALWFSGVTSSQHLERENRGL